MIIRQTVSYCVMLFLIVPNPFAHTLKICPSYVLLELTIGTLPKDHHLNKYRFRGCESHNHVGSFSAMHTLLHIKNNYLLYKMIQLTYVSPIYSSIFL